MYYANTRSKTIHFSGCRYKVRMLDSNLAHFDSLNDPRITGYRICKCCNHMSNRMQSHESEINSFCKDNAFRCLLEDESLRVNTAYSQWKVYIGSDGRYVLYHKNTQGKITDYHLQKEGMGSLMEVLKYVDHHNQYRLDNPLPKGMYKSEPKKGTKRYKTELRKAAAAKRRKDINRVLNLIDSLSKSCQ